MAARKSTQHVRYGPAWERPPDAADRLAVLAAAVRAHPERPLTVRTAKLLAGGIARMAQKVIEEAAEVAIDAVRAERADAAAGTARAGVIAESADLLYNLTVLLAELGIHPSEIWAEMGRRGALPATGR